MTRVCHMTSVHPWDDVRIFHKECCSLAEAGFDTHLVACASDSRKIDGVTVHAVPRAGGGRLGRMFGTALRVYRAARALNADIYHFHDPELLPYGLLLRWQGKRVIYDAHEDVPRDILSKPWIKPLLRHAIATMFERFENFSARRMSAVVAATPHIARRFALLNARSLDINNYPMQRELLSDVKPVDAGRTVCYVGGISRSRGAIEMIAALEHVDARLILAGKIESSTLEAELRAMPGWRKVDYRGLVTRAEVRNIFAQSQLGLLLFHPDPNHVDAQPNKMFEYMSAGLPVIASDFPLWRELIVTADTGICVDPSDPIAVGRSIAALLDDASRLQRMGASGRAAVLQTYRWEPQAARLIGLYDDLMGT